MKITWPLTVFRKHIRPLRQRIKDLTAERDFYVRAWDGHVEFDEFMAKQHQSEKESLERELSQWKLRWSFSTLRTPTRRTVKVTPLRNRLKRVDAKSRTYLDLWQSTCVEYSHLQSCMDSLRRKQYKEHAEMETILASLREYFPIHWDSQHSWGCIVVSSCPDCKREESQHREIFTSLERLVRMLLEKVASGQRHESVLCHRCSPLDVTEGEDGKWRVVTAICQIGGCDASYAEFDSKDEAEGYAKRFYESGGRLSYHGLCPECAAEYREMCS